MNNSLRRLLLFPLRLVRTLLVAAGAAALLAAALQFTGIPWRAYNRLADVPGATPLEPTHILLMGGSGIPGKSGLMRTYYAALAAARHPDADLLVAMPLGDDTSESSSAYLDELRLRGVLSERMRILPGGRNTREQALRLAEHLAQEIPTASVLIVSDPPHIRRTAACLRRVGFRHLAAFPAHPVAIEDPLGWKAAELEIHSCTAPAESAPPPPLPFVPDIGVSTTLRYNLWNNLGYSVDALREHTALLYYRLHGWI
ncbi:MAG: YdcF family protein [Lentisphaerae bacterium]|nr:YdcF family protein [Lentisphaerota bacterium]